MHFAVSDYMADIVENALEAGSRSVFVAFREHDGGFDVEVRDDGPGMDPEQAVMALDPYRTDGSKHRGRHVGLGLPFLKQAVDASGGFFELDTARGRGTAVRFRFDKGNVDCPPLGDLPSLFLSILSMAGDANVVIRRERAGGDLSPLSYELDKRVLAELLGDLEDASSLALLREYLRSQETD